MRNSKNQNDIWEKETSIRFIIQNYKTKKM